MMTPTFKFDAQLLRWSNTSNGGPTITLALADADDLVPFMLMQLKKAGMVGQILGCSFTEHDGNGVREEAAPKRGGSKFPDGFCGLAVMWCREREFLRWLTDNFPMDAATAKIITDNDESIDVVSSWILRSVCGITSRTELNTDGIARTKFDSLIRQPYAAYRKELGLE